MHCNPILNRCTVRAPRRHGGVVLVITLILLVVIAISSAVALRTALVEDLATNSLRTQTAGLQAAEMALRYCEDQAMVPAPAIAIVDLPAVDANNPTAWTDMSNWEGAGARAMEVPSSTLTSSAAPVSYNRAPQCLVELMELQRMKGAPLERAFLVTARGFSPDYRRDSDGNAISGSEVWLQSSIRQRD